MRRPSLAGGRRRPRGARAPPLSHEATARSARLRRSLLSLGVGELTAALLFAVVFPTVLLPLVRRGVEVWALVGALLPLLLVLVQGGVYWLSSVRWADRRPMPRRTARIYRFWRTANPVLMGLGLLALVVGWPQDPLMAIASAGLWAFGAVEHVNYYVVRLSYPLTEWVSGVRRRSVPRLVRDLRAADRQD